MQRLADAVILPAGPADALPLARVHVTAWRETYSGLLPKAYLEGMSVALHAARWRRQLTRPRQEEVAMVAEGRGGVVGYCSGAIKGSGGASAEVFTLYLTRPAQGRGLGRGLLTSTARVLAARGAASLELWVLNGNVRAFEFYRKLGGRVVDQRAVRGWGGALLETRCRWADISILLD